MSKDEALNYLANELELWQLNILLDDKVNLKDTKGVSQLWLNLLSLLSLSEITQEWNRKRHLKREVE